MSEGAPEIQPQGGVENSSPGINPAWNDALNDIPKEFHHKVIPHLQKWDSGVNERFQRVQSQYEPYKAYEPFVQNQIPFEEVQQGYGLLRAIYEDPAKVITAIQQAFNLGQPVLEQGETEVEDPGEYANVSPEVMAQLQRQEQMLNAMAQIMTRQREAQMAASEGQKLDKIMADLHKEHGEFNDEVVLHIAAQMNGDIGAALGVYQNAVQQEMARRNAPRAPRLISPGGSAPSNAIDPRKLNSRQTQDLIVDMLKAAKGAS